MKPKQKKVLIITSSGGGGLLQAAIAKEQELLADDPTVLIAKRDLLKDWYWKILGIFAVFAWNTAQKRGNVFVLESLLRMQRAADPLFWVRIFVHTLRTLFKEDVDRVIDTQPLGTSAILRALRIYNRRRNKKVFLEKIVVDLPTEKNTHFFRSIKGLSKKNRKLLRLVTIPPLLHEGQTAEEFWRKNCNLSEHDIIYQKYAIRQAFKKFHGKTREDCDFVIHGRMHNAEERQILSQVLQGRPLRTEILEKTVRFHISPNDTLITVLLGSKPAFEATLSYVRNFIELAKEKGTIETPIHLFAFCGPHHIGEQSLIKCVAELVRDTDFPKQLSIVPMSFQSDETIAQVFYRSNLTCTRSGGQTAMELMCVMNGEIWIHSEAKRSSTQKSELSMDQLLKGIPGWEAGNAVYLHRFRNAKIVTPETFVPFGRQFLSTDR